MHIYYCWITALLPSYQDGIVAGLAKRGYMVGPASKDGQVSIVQENSPSALVSLSVYKQEEDINVSKIYDDVIAVLTEMKAYYHSVIISLSYEATWVGSNVQVPPKPKPVGNPPIPSGKKKNIN